MRGRSHFGPGAYVVRYAWWGPLVPAVAGAAIVAGFLLGVTSRPPWLHWRPGAHLDPWGWTMYGAQWLMPLVGAGLLVFAVVGLRRVARGAVAFAVAEKGVYWCPSGKPSQGEWFAWDEVTAIEFHSADGGSTGRGAVALRGYAPERDDRPRLVSTRLGGWRIAPRRLGRALREFAPDVEVISH
ncbi:hypothetical protein OG417_43210 [Actinoallomurus sp. NBC_01490]|jgi:hypothetical protein|uniref:hypothetical protein n=1 Tax=Actinoallomurus sp. NBC_01490 TaxID=2903557 RepID=UPI002E2FB9ED|nr:hypothetical protein [Actinoallomurus sp. NBC_01490]